VHRGSGCAGIGTARFPTGSRWLKQLEAGSATEVKTISNEDGKCEPRS